ncbi:hypothetical protein BS78_K197200 [Paspalum vaginatum]|uniref:AAA+ ATPase domain-containing protein n=1 Tax=Paspalum vaginatum TaxID=158149 RepID=A0A9W7XDX8_9POAL|nr:hypothetical protein BS78_K197200 [Paspalum vaginatum]
MESAMGALGVLLPKLTQLLQDEYNLHKNAKKDIQYVSKELQRIYATLQMVSEMQPENLTKLVKMWVADVRELSYDMEDIVDSFLVRVQGPERPNKKGTKRILKEMTQKLTKAWAYSGIGHEIKDLKERVKEVADRRDRYKIETVVPAKTTSVDPRVTALYTNLTKLVGIDEAREELITRVIAEDDTSTLQQRIISIVGFGGLGKTTLAKAVCEKLKNKFDCTALIPVSRNPDTKKLLKDILYELDKQKYENIHGALLDERQLIDLAREFLQNKRYFIVIDDIWSMEPWDVLSCALVDNNMISRIIITTRKIDVAEQVGGYCYKLKPLSPDSSKMLFCRRIFGCGDIFPEQYYEVSEKFLKKCAGVPLAIITTSGLLANKLGNVKEWHQLCDSIGSGIGRNDDMENMRKILSLSYYDLPSHRKTCLLYLSIYPEDYKIDKEELIWKWIAEGFVQHGKGGQSLFEIGESYFHELVNRSLVQPIYSSDHDSSTLHDVDEPWSCHVHDMVLDLISSLSREENFATTVLGDDNGDTYSGNKIHRLALHDTNWPTRDISRLNISKLRSLTIFGSGCIINSMPPSLPCYRLLRVLDLRYSNFVCGHSSLRLFIGNLVHLRYLRLPWDVYTDEVLAEIGKLQYLQWLDLGGAENIRELPSSILGLKKLMLLFINTRIRLPAGLKNLTSLEELRHQVLVDSVQLAEEQGHLTQLRILSLVVSLEMKKDEEGRWDESLRTALVGSLANLHKIQTLDIYNNNYESDLDGSMDSPLGNLRDLIIFSIKLLPSWINPVTLPLLSRLQIIMVSQVRRQDIQVLGMLQALTSLDIRVSGGRPRPRVLERSVVGADAFPCLVECTLLGFPVVPSMFPAGAMPRLETFRFYIDLEAFSTGGDLTVDDDLALGHLPSLQEVAVSKLVTAGDEAVSSQDEVATKVKEKLWHEKDVHPNHPSIYLY